MEFSDENRRPDLVREFKGAMRRLAATVTIVTTAAEGSMHGMTATAVTSLSTDPPAILVCVNRSASIHPMLRVGQAFCVNILGPAHMTLSSAFGGKVEPELRFNHGTWEQDADGVPFLPDASALVFCTVDLLSDYATHTLVVGRVSRAVEGPESASLIYGNGGFLTVHVSDA